MRHPHAARRWRRTVIVLGAVLIAGPLTVGEAIHLLRYGHLGLGLHADLVSWEGTTSLTTGAPGVATYSALWGVNLTPLPLPLRVCTGPSDIGRQTVFRYSVERWTGEHPRWTAVMATKTDCQGELIHAEWKVLWPGASVNLITHEAPGDRSDYGFKNGDRFRFTVFTLFDWPDDSWLQIRVVSQEHVVIRAPAAR